MLSEITTSPTAGVDEADRQARRLAGADDRHDADVHRLVRTPTRRRWPACSPPRWPRRSRQPSATPVTVNAAEVPPAAMNTLAGATLAIAGRAAREIDRDAARGRRPRRSVTEPPMDRPTPTSGLLTRDRQAAQRHRDVGVRGGVARRGRGDLRRTGGRTGRDLEHRVQRAREHRHRGRHGRDVRVVARERDHHAARAGRGRQGDREVAGRADQHRLARRRERQRRRVVVQDRSRAAAVGDGRVDGVREVDEEGLVGLDVGVAVHEHRNGLRRPRCPRGRSACRSSATKSEPAVAVPLAVA